MWIELKQTDDISILNEFADIRNDFGCSKIFTGDIVKANMINKINCTYFKFDSKKYNLLIGFKFNQGTEKMTWMTFLIINCIEEDYPEALRQMAKKTKEIMKKYQLGLLNEYNYKELELVNQTFKFGYYKCFNILKTEFEKLGLKCTFNDNKIEVIYNGS